MHDHQISDQMHCSASSSSSSSSLIRQCSGASTNQVGAVSPNQDIVACMGDIKAPFIKNNRPQKAFLFDALSHTQGFIDPAEFPFMNGNDDSLMRIQNRHAPLRPQGQYNRDTALVTRQVKPPPASCGISDANGSSGFSIDTSGCGHHYNQHHQSSITSLRDSTGKRDLQWTVPNNADVWDTVTARRNQLGVNAPTTRDVLSPFAGTFGLRHRSDSFSSGSGTGSDAHQQGNHIQRSSSITVASLFTECPLRKQQRNQLNSKGNIFRQRKDFSAFQSLHPTKKNGYFIQLEDDSCTGNEDTRAFLLCQLTNHGASELKCIACCASMPVYDHFPVVDGALFLSPLCHRGGLRVCWNSPAPATNRMNSNASTLSAGQLLQGTVAPPPGCTGPRQQQSVSGSGCVGGNYRFSNRRTSISQERYLHAICMTCMRSTGDFESPSQIVCKFCDKPWNGSTFLIGGMYTYDPFAAMPCCAQHLKCKSCGRQALSHLSTKSKSLSCSGSIVSEDILDQAQPQRRFSDGQQNKSNSTSTLLLPLPFFSQYSRLMCCQHCCAVDYHFLKTFDEMYDVHQPT